MEYQGARDLVRIAVRYFRSSAFLVAQRRVARGGPSCLLCLYGLWHYGTVVVIMLAGFRRA